MSYARFAPESDVYVFASVGGHLECCGCSIATREAGRLDSAFFLSTQDLLDHLDEHKAAGHAVPDYCTARLEEERDELDEWLAEENAPPKDIGEA